MSFSVYRQNYNLKEIEELVHRTMELVSKSGEAEIVNNPLFLDLVEINKAFTAAIHRTHSGIGEELTRLDDIRDGLHANIYKVIKGFAKIDIPPRHEAACALLAIFDRWGSVVGLSYAEETSVLRNLLNDLAAAPNPAHLATLGLDDALAALINVQEAFEDLTMAKGEEAAELAKQVSASSLRRDVLKKLGTFCRFAESMTKVSAPWQDFYSKLDEVLAQV